MWVRAFTLKLGFVSKFALRNKDSLILIISSCLLLSDFCGSMEKLSIQISSLYCAIVFICAFKTLIALYQECHHAMEMVYLNQQML